LIDFWRPPVHISTPNWAVAAAFRLLRQLAVLYAAKYALHRETAVSRIRQRPTKAKR
jgi:hypothetical protein